MLAFARLSSTRLADSLVLVTALVAGAFAQSTQAQTLTALTVALPAVGAPSSALVQVNGDQQLLTAPTALVGGDDELVGLVRNPVTGDVFSVAEGVSLVKVDLAGKTVTEVGELPATIQSLAFDSHGNLYGFAYCDKTFANQLFQIDPKTGNGIGILPSLDSGTLAPCSADGVNAALIAINPANDVLYMAGTDSTGQFFIDRFDSAFVPTQVYANTITGDVVTAYPLAATFAAGKMWISLGTLQALITRNGGELVSFDPVTGKLAGGGNHSFPETGFTFSILSLGLLPSLDRCQPSATATCLNDRFLVQATYDATPANGKGPATVLLESAQSVKFSFFDASNVEMIVKVLNACVAPFNRWWVAAGGLTNVGVTLKVTDTKTGKTKTYSNPKNTLFQPFFDTEAFACP
jgi:hypothetical protein